MPLLIDVSDEEVGEEGGRGWGGLSTDARMVRGEGDGGWSRTSAIFFQRSAISARRAAISAEHEVCCLRGGHLALLSMGGLGREVAPDAGLGVGWMRL